MENQISPQKTHKPPATLITNNSLIHESGDPVPLRHSNCSSIFPVKSALQYNWTKNVLSSQKSQIV
jgi:hypothetical protein